MSKSSLSSLLNYRFVRKKVDKIQRSESSESDQESSNAATGDCRILKVTADQNSNASTSDCTILKVTPGVETYKYLSQMQVAPGGDIGQHINQVPPSGETSQQQGITCNNTQNSQSILLPTDHGYSKTHKQSFVSSNQVVAPGGQTVVSSGQIVITDDATVSSSTGNITHKHLHKNMAEIRAAAIIELDSDSNSPKVNTIPETPASELPPPDSPVLCSKSKGPNQIVIDDSDEEDAHKKESSPWLSKEQGKQMTNGVVPGPFNRRKSKNIALKDFSDSDEDPLPSSGSTSSSSKPSQLTADQEGKFNQLRQMFPAHPTSGIVLILKDTNWDVEKAVDVLMVSGSPMKTTSKKRIKQLDSSDSDDNVSHPRKRIRQLQSSEETTLESQGTGTLDSQATEIYSSSQTVVDDGTKEERIKFLSGAFAGRSRRELYRALEENNWDVEKATIILSSAPEEADQKLIDAMDDEDENFDSGDEGAASDDSFEDEPGAKSQKEIILSFFEESTYEELCGTPGCSKKKAELIMSIRPFESWEMMVEKFATTKGLSYDVISGCKEIINVRNVVSNLMGKCEKIAEEMESVVAYLTRKTEMEEEEFYDAIQITKQPQLLNENFSLKPYQMVGLNWLRIMHTQDLNGILADEMGLGKTIQTIAFLAHLLEEGDDGPHVIIVPSSTIENWIREMETWCPSLNYVVYYGSQEDRRSIRQSVMYDRDAEFNVLLTTYNMATGGVEDRSLFKKFQFHYAVFDEGHMLKNMSSLRYQNLMKINAERRLLLTGTPLQNNLIELMSLLCFVMPNMFVGKTDHLRKMFTMISKTNDDRRSKYEAERIAHAKRIMKPFVLRRLKSEVLKQLPSKHEEIIKCQMIPDQQEIYEKMVAKFSKELRERDEDKENIPGGSSMLMQLRKVANHPLLIRELYDNKTLRNMSKAIAKEPSHRDRGALPDIIYEDLEVMHDFEIHKLCGVYKKHIGSYKLDDSVISESGKFRELESLLTTMKSQNDRVVIFSQFVMMMDILEDFFKLKKYCYLRLDGSTPVVERQQLIDKFNNDDSIFLFMISTRAGGLGINLTAANVAILHDIDFNPYNDKQAEDRIHRVGQTREVRVIRLISKDTIEEAMLKCAREKLKLEKDVTTDEGDAGENPKDVVSLLKQALSEGKV